MTLPNGGLLYTCSHHSVQQSTARTSFLLLPLLLLPPSLHPARSCQIRDHTHLLTKVHVVGGDISQPGLGLSPADRDKLASRVNFIIHCAADIRLEADIQVSYQ